MSRAGKSDPLRDKLDQVLTQDYPRLLGRWRRLHRSKGDSEKARAALAQAIDASMARREARAASVPDITLDEALPIGARAEEIIAAIRKHQVLVVAGETGSGKTTQLPKLCLAAGRGVAGLIGCTQPRRLAARSMARRVAAELGTELGDKVGYQVRFSEKLGEANLVKFMTDGILLAETRADRWLNAYDTLIIDEAHERSLNIDFLLGYLKRLARKRPQLKIIITSATIDTARFAEHFDDAPVIEVEGRTWPVELHWRPLEGDDLERHGPQGSAAHIAHALDEISAEDPRGDVLVFLPGEREIRDAHRVLARRQYRHTEILPLYARLSASEQDRVFNPGPARRVVLATNIAETSLTVPRIRYVIDTGTARVKRYSRRSQIERLHIEPVSQAAADQRKGRCGRLGPGVCLRLYDEEDFAARPRFTDPELLRSSLANVILRMLDLGLGDVDRFPFLEPPEARAIADGYRQLADLQAIDGQQKLTAIGRQLPSFPVDVQLARMLVEADKLGVAKELRIIVAFLGIQDPRQRPADARGQADAAHREFADSKSDFSGILKLWQAFDAAHQALSQRKLRDWCQRHFLSYPRMREWRALHRQLKTSGNRVPGRGGSQPAMRLPSGQSTEAVGYEAIHRAILSGLPLQVARKDEDGQFIGTRQRKFRVFPGSALVKKPPPWLLAGQILDLGGRVWGMLCAAIEPRWVEQQAAHLLKHAVRDPHWSPKRGKVVASEQVSLFGLVLVANRSVSFQRQDPALAHALFLEQALATCDIDARAGFIKTNRNVLAEARDIEAQQRQQGLLREPQELAQFFRGKLPEAISTRAALDRWWRKADGKARAALVWSLDDVLEAGTGQALGDFPAELVLGDEALALDYYFQPGDDADGVNLTVPLALLNALPQARLEWLVPGLLPDKVVALIKSLPKKLRRNFVPAPDFARAFCEAEPPRDAPLAPVLAAFLQRTTGVTIDATAFASATLPPHLAMRLRVIDAKGKTMAISRDIDALQAELGGRARKAFAHQANHDWLHQPATSWEFGELPQQVDTASGVAAWPALVDLGDAVTPRLFETRDEAEREHAAGVARLLRLQLAGAVKTARRKLPIAADIELKALPLAGSEDLRAEVVEGALHDLLAEADLGVRDAPAFAALQESLRKALFQRAVARLEHMEAIVTAHAELKPWLEPPMMGFATASYEDMETQLDQLLAHGFVQSLPLARLAELPRYLKAMRLRAERLRQDPARDRQRLLDLQPVWNDYQALRKAGVTGSDMDKLRWLLEEFRVSLFAQDIGTAEKVSAKRLTRLIEQLGADAP